jgi:hypothetical protein
VTARWLPWVAEGKRPPDSRRDGGATAQPPCGFLRRPTTTTAAPRSVGKIQRSEISEHPEKHDPTNCVASENPRIAILVPNRLWIPRLRPSGRCIHARLLNMLNLTCGEKRTVPHVPTYGWDGLNCIPERSRKQIKICTAHPRGKRRRRLPQPGYRPVMYPSSSRMACACPEMVQRTRSPIETTPTTTSLSTTGR